MSDAYTPNSCFMVELRRRNAIGVNLKKTKPVLWSPWNGSREHRNWNSCSGSRWVAKCKMKAVEGTSIEHAKLKRDLRKKVTIEKMNHDYLFRCTIYDRQLPSFTGLKSHLRTHGKWNTSNYSPYTFVHNFQFTIYWKNYKSNEGFERHFKIHKDQNLSAGLRGLNQKWNLRISL